MHDLTQFNKIDSEALLEYLGPTGILLNCVNKLQLDPFLRYPMPKIVRLIVLLYTVFSQMLITFLRGYLDEILVCTFFKLKII